ncbi:hypothetical protein DES32_0365 [Methylovirgula ligni]|uniref:Carbon monoxide dehydrogenase subunit G n=1 Tax=Methylovirgula ligni TaxID=569860 RepID=A0A3D9Z4J4_9HYPH|nr:SRPBCC family protein [Methylovirgula ligni]REF89150.1 hypothetical protein DES32_0365 [Methylovirgula ligni]
MKLDIDRSLELPVSADQTWNFLDQIDKVASCLPGAKITQEIDPTHYRGTVSVRLGPVNLTFLGAIEILARDPAARTISLAGKGADKGGTSVAEMELTAAVTETGPASSRVSGKANVTVNGKAASMGARLLTSASDQIIKEFYTNLQTKVQAEPTPAVASVATVAPSAPAAPVPASISEAPAPAPQTSINGFAFLWAVIKSFFAGLFTGKQVSP